MVTMTQMLPGKSSRYEITNDPTTSFMVPQLSSRKWYLSSKEIEDLSPSRKDGIDFSMESHLRNLYCSFLKDLGKTLKVPQMTIATAIMFCHRFYLRQSLAKNDWQLISTASMFLACKAEDTPCSLMDVVVVAYELTYKWDPSAQRRIKQKELYDKQKELVLTGEELLLKTIGFELNIEHPYKPLVNALKILDISHKDIAKVAWNFVNDWLCTTLCLQYKPHYIAAASLFLAAKFHKVKLPTENGKVWWLQFDISPKQLEDVIQHMLRSLEKNRKQSPEPRKVAESKAGDEKVISQCSQPAKISSSATAQCSSSITTVDSKSPCQSELFKNAEKQNSETQTSDYGSAHSVVEDFETKIQPPKAEKMDFGSVLVKGAFGQIDVNRIKEKMRKRQLEKASNTKRIANSEIDSKSWIETELENGIEVDHYTSAEKKQRMV